MSKGAKDDDLMEYQYHTFHDLVHYSIIWRMNEWDVEDSKSSCIR